MTNYSVVDINGYASAMREGAAKSLSEEYTENLDEFISINQVINLIKKNSLGKDEEGNLIINEKIFDYIFDSLIEWLYGVGLAKLAAKGLLECAWDSKQNEMIFWLPDENKTTIKSKPMNSTNNVKPKRKRKK